MKDLESCNIIFNLFIYNFYLFEKISSILYHSNKLNLANSPISLTHFSINDYLKHEVFNVVFITYYNYKHFHVFSQVQEYVNFNTYNADYFTYFYQYLFDGEFHLSAEHRCFRVESHSKYEVFSLN